MAFLQAEIQWTSVALVANTAKSVGGFKTPANQAVKILEVCVSHDGATSSNAPDITDFARSTFATNAPGTNSSSFTLLKKDPGRQETVQTSGGTTWTTEPTVLTVFRNLNLAQYREPLLCCAA